MSAADQVVLKDLSIFARHGLFDAEADLGQRFYIDVVVAADLGYAEREDEAEGTVNWADLVKVTTAAFTGRRYKLIEAAAAAIATAVLARFERATHGQGRGSQTFRADRGSVRLYVGHRRARPQAAMTPQGI